MTLSPMMKQYMQTKEKYKDCILFYRLGDFYEMFFDDAIKVSKMLDLTLTGRDCGLKERAPMCGVPYHAADTYIARLVEKGEKVAICEQLTEPKDSKGIVERGVVKVVTAGTLTDENWLDEKSNNFLLSFCSLDDQWGYSYCDITTGDFYCGTINGIQSFADFLVALSPAEIICNLEGYESIKEHSFIKSSALVKPQLYNEWAYKYSSAKQTLKNQLNVLSLDAFSVTDEKLAVGAAGALVEYLKETQKHSLKNINKLQKINNEDFLFLDYNTIRNLEITKSLRDFTRYGTLIWLMDKTVTGMGARMLASWLIKPLHSIDKINLRLDGVENFYKSTLVRQGIRELLKSVKDIERLSGKLSNNNFSPRDCIALKNSLKVLPLIKFQLSGMSAGILNLLNDAIYDADAEIKLIENAVCDECPPTIKDGGYIKKGHSAELDELRNISKNGKSVIAEIELRERQETGIKNLKIGYNRVFGYYIEVTNSFLEQVPYSYTRRQTLTNAERYVTDELKNTEEKILTAQDKSLRLEEQLFEDIKNSLLTKILEFQNIAKAIAEIDCLCSLAHLARENSYSRPEITPAQTSLDIIGGRHPVVEQVSKEKFVPNDTLMNNDKDRMLIVTGPNMAGKSTYMRQVALITLMAHIGSFVPATSAKVPLTDRIFTRIGASDNLVSDQSTFMVEMTETALILHNATKNSLIILDEIGRGTSTFDGLSIAWAVVEYLTANLKAKSLFATHYHELTELEGMIEGVKNYKISVKEFGGSIIFLRKIVRGGANKSFGIEVAELAGVPKVVTSKAKAILKKLENKDIVLNYTTVEDAPKKTKIETILSEINIEQISPVNALNILSELIEDAKNL